MNDFAAATGRQYKPFEFYGHPQAERVIVIMGSAIGTCEEVVDELLSRGEKVGVLKVRLTAPSPPPTCWKRCRKAPAP
jgi:pyruvate-ferredoxin/flavodoxin oxidoreductase